jgi:hypothetical protein
MAKVTNVVTGSMFKYGYIKYFILRCWCACLSLLHFVNASYNILLSIIIVLFLFPEVKLTFFSITQSYHWTLGNLEQLIQKWLIMKQMAPLLSTGEGSFVSLGIWRRGSAHRWESIEPKWTTSTAAVYFFSWLERRSVRVPSAPVRWRAAQRLGRHIPLPLWNNYDYVDD